VIIEVSDDGRGMDTEAIHARAIEMGLINSEARLTQQEILSLTLTPAFSTAKTVTDISGRGVGMDVVKKNMESMGGSVSVRSQAGAGSTITLKVPLTLAIIDGLLVKISSDFFVLPMSTVEECIEIDNSLLKERDGRRLVAVRSELVPYIRLREHFDINGQRPALEQAVVVNLDGARVGFVVDAVVGKHQTVIKSMGRIYKDLAEVSGATILGNGSVALVLDAQKLYSGSLAQTELTPA